MSAVNNWQESLRITVKRLADDFDTDNVGVSFKNPEPGNYLSKRSIEQIDFFFRTLSDVQATVSQENLTKKSTSIVTLVNQIVKAKLQLVAIVSDKQGTVSPENLTKKSIDILILNSQIIQATRSKVDIVVMKAICNLIWLFENLTGNFLYDLPDGIKATHTIISAHLEKRIRDFLTPYQNPSLLRKVIQKITITLPKPLQACVSVESRVKQSEDIKTSDKQSVERRHFGAKVLSPLGTICYDAKEIEEIDQKIFKEFMNQPDKIGRAINDENFHRYYKMHPTCPQKLFKVFRNAPLLKNSCEQQKWPDEEEKDLLLINQILKNFYLNNLSADERFLPRLRISSDKKAEIYYQPLGNIDVMLQDAFSTAKAGLEALQVSSEKKGLPEKKSGTVM